MIGIEVELQYIANVPKCFMFLNELHNIFALASHQVLNFMHQRIYECTLNVGTLCNCQVVLYRPQL